MRHYSSSTCRRLFFTPSALPRTAAVRRCEGGSRILAVFPWHQAAALLLLLLVLLLLAAAFSRTEAHLFGVFPRLVETLCFNIFFNRPIGFFGGVDPFAIDRDTDRGTLRMYQVLVAPSIESPEMYNSSPCRWLLWPFLVVLSTSMISSCHRIIISSYRIILSSYHHTIISS